MRHAFARRAPILVALSMLLVLGVIVALAADSAPAKSKGVTMFFIGNRNSEIEPCGCVKNQLGGIQFEATIYKGIPRESSIRVDVGAWSARNASPEISMKGRYALRAMGGFLDLDAVNVGQADLSQGAAFFKDVEAKNPESVKPLISANIFLVSQPEKRAFAPYRIVERSTPDGKKVKVALIGATADLPAPLRKQPGFPTNADKDYKIVDPSDALKPVLAEVKGKADLSVVLFCGTWEETMQLAQAVPEIDVLVTTTRSPDFNQKSATIGKTRIVAVHNVLGKELGKIEFVPSEGNTWTLAADPEWVGVDPKLQPAKEMVDLINEYKKNTADLIVARPAQVKMTYAGAQYCASCHLPQYQSWMKTQHAQALATLVAKGSQFDPSCLVCHTLGFKKDNGFYNAKDSRSMANVQCESCHGAAYQHAEKENLIRNKSINRFNEEERQKFLAEAKALIPPARVPAQTCILCHQGDNDPNFNYGLKVPKVNHSDAPPPDPKGGLPVGPPRS